MIYKFENLKEFTLKAFDCAEPVSVEIFDGESDFVEIEVSDKDCKKLEIVVSDDSLTVGTHMFARLKSLKISICARALQSISASGRVELNCKKTAKNCKVNLAGSVSSDFRLARAESTRLFPEATENLKLSLAGSNKAMLFVALEALEISAAGSSSLTLEGKSGSAVFKTCGSTKVDAQALFCQSIVLKSSGASKLRIFAEEKLDISLSGMGSLEYSGAPEIVGCNTSGAISICKCN